MNKTALITGASSGIGMATAKLLSTAGYRLILAARREEILQKLASELPSETLVMKLDVRDKAAVFAAIEKLPVEWKEIDILINNAGLASGMSTIDKGDIEDWENMIDTNIKGLLYITRAILPTMVERGNGHIVNIGSIAAKEAYANGNIYCSTKAAVDMLNRNMRIDLLNYPIKVTAIHPGAVETEFSIVRFHGDEERAKKVYQGFESLVGFDVAEAILFAINRPAHVNINELTIMPTAQAVAGVIHRR
ncbi:MAG: SDR family NAD(P)-dependent oxidoreductase [Bacteroidota bacterium]|nr:SDR family NAD(P)-dependent oxidoreductase [Bacteroidota bacterium]